MKISMLALITAAVATTIGLAATAHADDNGPFQSPSGNIYCLLYVGNDGRQGAACQVHQHTYAAPPPGDCHLGGWGSQFDLKQGDPPRPDCVGGELVVPPMPTLGYGQARSVGAITCDSEPSGLTCTDTSTGHFFRVSSESYQLG